MNEEVQKIVAMKFKDTPLNVGEELAIVLPEDYALFLLGRIEGKNYLDMMNDPAISEIVRIVTELQRMIMSAGFNPKGEK